MYRIPHITKIGNANFFHTFFLSSFPCLTPDGQFFGYDQPKGGQKNCWSRIFHFSRFFGFLGPFWVKNRVFLEILGKNGPKIRKNAKNEKSATNNFFDLLLASHSQKIGCLAKKVEKQIGKVLKKPVFSSKFPIQKGHYAAKYTFRSQLGGRRVKAPGELFKFRKKFLNPCIPNFKIC